MQWWRFVIDMEFVVMVVCCLRFGWDVAKHTWQLSYHIQNLISGEGVILYDL